MLQQQFGVPVRILVVEPIQQPPSYTSTSTSCSSMVLPSGVASPTLLCKAVSRPIGMLDASRCYSDRKAWAGSIDAARRAGMVAATQAAAVTTAIAAKTIPGSTRVIS
jgi:hypothetical protein